MPCTLCMTDILHVLRRWRCSCNNCSYIQCTHKLFMGCKAGASLGSFCCELWWILAGGAALPYQPSCQIDCIPRANAWNIGACWILETKVWGTWHPHQGHVGFHQVHRWVQGAYFWVHTWNGCCQCSYSNSSLLDHSEHCGMRFANYGPHRHGSRVCFLCTIFQNIFFFFFCLPLYSQQLILRTHPFLQLNICNYDIDNWSKVEGSCKQVARQYLPLTISHINIL